MERAPISLVAAAENLDRRLDICYFSHSGRTQFQIWDDNAYLEPRLVETFDSVQRLAYWLSTELEQAGVEVDGLLWDRGEELQAGRHVPHHEGHSGI